jgi:type IV secretion system protein VirB10
MALVPGSAPDPRTLAPAPVEEGVGPVVALPRQGLPKAVLVAFAIVAALILFVILESRRRATVEVSATTPQAVGVAAPAPPLVLPAPVQPAPVQMQPQPQIYVQPQPRYPAPAAPIPQRADPPPVRTQPQIVYVPQPQQTQPQIQPQIPPSGPRASGDAALVIDTTVGVAGAGGPNAGNSPDGGGPGGVAAIAGNRARAGSLANRTTTVPQGTLIPAVMETAFNSNRPGLARAIVSRDIRGFDGSRVLIPRGSRLIGEYRTDTRPGQRRALVNWLRLIRPDGVTIAIGSPSTDTLGRSGIRANVNTHFFQRFSGALLRSTVDLGLTLAAGAANVPLVVVPGGTGSVTQGFQPPTDIPATLTVRPGASISVFVARDLDFTGTERRR